MSPRDKHVLASLSRLHDHAVAVRGTLEALALAFDEFPELLALVESADDLEKDLGAAIYTIGTTALEATR